MNTEDTDHNSERFNQDSGTSEESVLKSSFESKELPKSRSYLQNIIALRDQKILSILEFLKRF